MDMQWYNTPLTVTLLMDEEHVVVGERETVTDGGGPRTVKQIMTWNVNGLLDHIKRSALMRYLQGIGPAVALLQETHLLGTKCSFLERRGYDNVFHAGFTRGSRGAAILLHRSLPFTVTDSKSEPGVRFVAVWGLMEGRKCKLVSVYAPPQLQKTTL